MNNVPHGNFNPNELPEDVKSKLRAMARIKSQIDLARTDPNHFMSYVFGFHQHEYMSAMQDMISENPRSVIMVSPESGKSSQATVGRTLYELGRNPDLRCLIVTANLELGKNFLSEIKQHIENNPRLVQVFPNSDKLDQVRKMKADAKLKASAVTAPDVTTAPGAASP